MNYQYTIQEVVPIFDFNGQILNGASKIGKDIACIGHVMSYGMLYSDQNVTLIIEQGVDENAGAFVYDYIESIPVAAGTSEEVEVPIVGKFVRVRVTNASGAVANVRGFFAIRSQE
jgi:hypothetical protein